MAAAMTNATTPIEVTVLLGRFMRFAAPSVR